MGIPLLLVIAFFGVLASFAAATLVSTGWASLRGRRVPDDGTVEWKAGEIEKSRAYNSAWGFVAGLGLFLTVACCIVAAAVAGADHTVW